MKFIAKWPAIMRWSLLCLVGGVTALHARGQQGCCSHHGGIAYCDYGAGFYRCVDGALSPSCECGLQSYSPPPSQGYFVPTPTCPTGSSYNPNTRNCECITGYVLSSGTCIPGYQYCTNKFGLGAQYNALKGSCECMTGYVFDWSCPGFVDG